MKKSIFIAAAMLLALAACRQANENAIMAPARLNQIQLTVTAGQGTETRTALAADGLSTIWGESEYLKVLEVAGTESSAFTSALGNITEDGSIRFQVGLNESDADSFSYYGVYPAADWMDGNTDPSAVKLNLPATQTPTLTSFGPEADLLVADPLAGLDSQPESLEMTFSRKVALGKMTLTNLPSPANVVSVAFKAEGKALAGISTFDLASGKAVKYGSGSEVADRIVLDYGDGVPSDKLVVYFTCWPCSLSAGDAITVEYSTAVATYTRTLTLPKALEFKANRASRFSVDMSGASEDFKQKAYKKVSSQEDLTDGIYLIVNETDSRAMNGGLGSSMGNTYNNITVSISDGKILSTAATDAAAFTITLAEGSIVSKGGYYIGNTGNTSNMSVTKSMLTNSIRIDGDGNAEIIAQGGSYLRYNSHSSKRQFRYFPSITYTTQQPVALYKLVGVKPEADLTKTVCGAYFVTGIEWLYEAGRSQMSRTWAGDSLKFAIVNPLSYTAVEMSGIPQNMAVGDAFPLTVSRFISLEKDAEAVSSTDYPVSVAKIEDTLVYLTTESGDLFLIKK